MPDLPSRRRIPGRSLLALLLSQFLLLGQAQASGFAIAENSAKELGVAFAGGSAIAEDGSTVWFNPAGMTRLGSTFQFSTHYIDPTFDFDDTGSAQLLPNGEIQLDGSRASGGGEPAIVPNMYYVRPLSERLYFGLGLNAPFGLTTKYDPNWIGRYQAVKSEIATLNVNPAIAYVVNEHLSVGAGLNINYMQAELTNAIDFAAICAAAAGGPCPNGSIPGQGMYDGFVINEADDTSVGVNVGLLWSPAEDTRIGLAYRSQINHSLTGEATFSAPAALGGFDALGPLGLALGAAFADSDITADVSLPDTASVSVFQRLFHNISVVGDVSWTDWADIPALRVEFTNPAAPQSAEVLNWNDSWRLSAGLIVDLNERWTVRSGYAYDESPVPDAAVRTSRLPDNDRQWLALGVSHRFSEAITVDVGYAHLSIRTAAIARLGSTANLLDGRFDSDADVVSLQVNYVRR
jgi:long-chain fatty acid transport protein